jgi:arginyl-tRNA synthetase
MNLFQKFRDVVIDVLNQLVNEGILPGDMSFDRVTAEPPRDMSHGDIATNAAMVLGKEAGKDPREIAEKLIERLREHSDIVDCSIAGPGFVNISLNSDYWLQVLGDVLNSGTSYGDSKMGQGAPMNVEFASVNPTGPMHVGHSRGAIYGDVLASLMEKAGYEVTREYYVNDAGVQIGNLAQSLYARYCEVLGSPIDDTGDYPGEYLIPVAQEIHDADGDKWFNKPKDVWFDYFRQTATDKMMDMIRADLKIVGIEYDVFSSEKAIVDTGEVDAVINTLEKKGLVYTGTLPQPKGKVIDDWEPVELLLLKATAYGDDNDRPLRKSDGSWTYLASDLAYHYDKIQRGFRHIVNVWGADHGGYVKRLAGAVKSMTDDPLHIEIKLCQMVRFFDKGQPFKMSKRAGTFVSLEDVVDKVGADVVRFMMMTRKNDAMLDFDFAKAVEQSKDNPVFYVQYAHARACSIRRHIKEIFPDMDISPASLANTDMSILQNDDDLAMIKVMSQWPRLIETAAATAEPHRIAFYLNDLAAAFHGLWTKGKENANLRFIFPEEAEKTKAKFALVEAVRTVIESGLNVIGVEAAEEMR